jgi:ubiquinol-cytochrome c reductase cytochrome b subunit
VNAVEKQLTGLRDWVDERFPLVQLWNDHMGQYYAPKNFNFWYYFGVLSIVVLAMQILTGIWLTMNYKPDADLAFASVEYIMRDVEWGWLIRYMHSTGASACLIGVYLDMFGALLCGWCNKPRELFWGLGMFS